MSNNPQICNRDVLIGGAYGCMSSTCFSGGRRTLDEACTDKQIRFFVNQYMMRGIEYRFVFTNGLIEKRHLDDVMGNIQLDIANEFGLAVIVHSRILEDYIRNKYPNIKLISSTTKMLSFEETLEELKQDYYYVVLNTQLNNRVYEIPKEYRDKIEILIDDCCPPFCPHRIECYERTYRQNLGQDSNVYNIDMARGIMFKDRDKSNQCKNEAKRNASRTSTSVSSYYKNMEKLCKHIMPNDITTLHKKGYSSFKMSGREKPTVPMLYQYARHFIKPEYQAQFLADVFNIMGSGLN